MLGAVALKWGLITGVATVLLVAVAGFIAYKKTEIPDPNKAFQTQTTYIYYAGGKTKVGQFAEQNRESISYAEMPDSIKDAVVAAENRSFWTDKGIDPRASCARLSPTRPPVRSPVVPPRSPSST